MDETQRVKMKTERKRKMREQKYKRHMGNQKEGQGFADRRKQQMVHKYKKLLRKEGHQLMQMSDKTRKVYKELENQETDVKTSPNKRKENEKKVSHFHKQEMESKNKKWEAQKRKEEHQKKQAAQEEALQKYQNKKKKQYKKIVKKNFRGQPNLASRMELLLEQIQKEKS